MNEKRSQCLICHGELTPCLRVENAPASAQNIPTPEQAAADQPITLELCQCASCGLVQLDVSPVDYYRDVIRAGGGSTTMKALRTEEYTRLLELLGERGLHECRVVEVGCGRGEFLRMWRDVKRFNGLPEPFVCGIEHSPSAVAQAVRDGLNVSEGFPEGDYTLPGSPFDAFVQFNFLEHQPDPLDMLNSIRRALRPGGLGLVTVPSLEYILRHDGYYELIRDHIAYYTKETLKALFERAGFTVLEQRVINQDTLEIIVENSPGTPCETPTPKVERIDLCRLEEGRMRLARQIRTHIDALARSGKRMAMWGASHQGFTFAATMALGSGVAYIIDSAPFKQGRVAPASHIPIVAPEYFYNHPVDEILIVAPGYTREIASIIREKYGESVEIYVLKSETIEVFS